MDKLLTQAQTMLHHAQMASHASTTAVQKGSHIYLAHLASRGRWTQYFEYVRRHNITVPESATNHGIKLIYK